MLTLYSHKLRFAPPTTPWLRRLHFVSVGAYPRSTGPCAPSRARSQFIDVLKASFHPSLHCSLCLREKKHPFFRRGVLYTVPLNFYKSRLRVPCSLCMITTAAVQGYLLAHSPVRSEMHFTEKSCRNRFQPVTIPLCCILSWLLFSSLRFAYSLHYMQGKRNLSSKFLREWSKEVLMLPPVRKVPHDMLPSLPNYHRTTTDSSAPYGSLSASSHHPSSPRR